MDKHLTTEGGEANIASTPSSLNSSSRPALTIDYALYDKYLEDADLTDEQRREFLDALWNIIVGFVDLGFGVHPLQQAGNKACEQNSILAQLLPPNSGSVVECGEYLKAEFNDTGDEQFGSSAESDET